MAMNHSLYSADRATHIKIVVVALVAGTLVAGLGVAARLGDSTTSLANSERTLPVVKAGAPVEWTTRGDTAVR
jgi:hypothetical protein